MRTGRKPKPRELREVEGNSGSGPLPPPDPSTAPLGPPPATLATHDDRKIWRRIRHEYPWLKRADRHLVELLVGAITVLRLSDTKLRIAVLSDDLRAAEAHRRIVNNARNDARRLLAEIGGTPASRVRIVGGDRKRDDDPTEREYFGAA